MDTTLTVEDGKAVVSVNHGINVPFLRVQRRATLAFNRYRKEHHLNAPWALTGRETRDTGRYIVSTEYTYIQMR